MKYNKDLIQRAYENKERTNEESKVIIEKLIEAYNENYAELREANLDIYELRSQLKEKQKRKKRKKYNKGITIKTEETFLGGKND